MFKRIILIFMIVFMCSCGIKNINQPDYEIMTDSLKREYILLRTQFNQSAIEDQIAIMQLATIAQIINNIFLGIEEFIEIIDLNSEEEREMLKKEYKNLVEMIDMFDMIYNQALIDLEEVPEVKPQAPDGFGI